MILNHKIENPDNVQYSGSAKKCFNACGNRLLKQEMETRPNVISLIFPDKTEFKAVYYKEENHISYYKLCL